MKNFIQHLLQSVLGFRTYCFLFALFKVRFLRWNPRENDFLCFLELLPVSGVILDIGANIGIMTVLMAKKSPASHLVAIEPVPENADTLERVARHYGLERLKVIRTALGDRNGTAKMIMPVAGGSRKQGLSHVAGDGAGGGRRFTVPMRRLDDLEELRDLPGPVTAVKIDVENFEYRVLEGGRGLIGRHRPVIYCELWDNENRARSIALLEALGYKTLVCRKGRLVLYGAESGAVQHFFFVP